MVTQECPAVVRMHSVQARGHVGWDGSSSILSLKGTPWNGLGVRVFNVSACVWKKGTRAVKWSEWTHNLTRFA